MLLFGGNSVQGMRHIQIANPSGMVLSGLVTKEPSHTWAPPTMLQLTCSQPGAHRELMQWPWVRANAGARSHNNLPPCPQGVGAFKPPPSGPSVSVRVVGESRAE